MLPLQKGRMPRPEKRMVEYQVTLVQRLCNNLPHPWQFPWLLPHWLTICQFTPKAYKVSSHSPTRVLPPYAAYEISRASFFSLFFLLRFLSAVYRWRAMALLRNTSQRVQVETNERCLCETMLTNPRTMFFSSLIYTHWEFPVSFCAVTWPIIL